MPSPQPTNISSGLTNNTLWARLLRTCDLDTHAAEQGGWRLRYEQLSQGRFCGEITQVQLPDVQLLSEHTNVALRQRGQLGDSVYGFALSLSAPAPVYFQGQQVPPDAVMCGRGNQIDMVTPPGHSLLAIVVERSLLTPLWERMYHKPLAGWLEHQLVLPASAASAQALRERHQQVLQHTLALARPQGPGPALLRPDSSLRRLRDDILIEWIEALPPSVDLADLDSRERRHRLVDQACEHMLSRQDEPLSVLEVCSRVGASRRKLNYCFQEVLGTSPTQYLRAIRLNGAQRELKAAAAGTTVQDTAARWGFWHLGQFAQDYRRQFSERPSETLARARGRAAGQ